MAECIIKGESIYTFPEFEQYFKELQEHVCHACRFIDGISPEEDRLRWDRLQVFHIAVMVFLNAFGYDFQKTPDEKFKEIINSPRKNKLIPNFIEMIERNRLSKQKEFKRTLSIINK